MPERGGAVKAPGWSAPDGRLLGAVAQRVAAVAVLVDEQEDQAPRKFDALVDNYFQTLSDDQIEKKNDGR